MEERENIPGGGNALYFGAITRLGKVEAGNTTTDYDPDEIKRQVTISMHWPPWSGTG